MREWWGEELLYEACDLGADFLELTRHVALFFAEPAEFGVATVWRWCALGHVATVGGGPVVGERVRYDGCVGRWTARVAAGRDRRPCRTPGRRTAEGRDGGAPRRRLDLTTRTVKVEASVPEMRTGELVTGRPKSGADARVVTLPEIIVGDLARHLQRFGEPEHGGLVFVGEKGDSVARSVYGNMDGYRSGRIGMIAHATGVQGGALARTLPAHSVCR